jgi:trk system potassium uptake protein TrkH
MVTDPLDRPILSHIHGRLIILGEDVDVAKAVREMHSQKAETIIVIKETRPVEIVTDSNILDKVDERRLPSNITKVHSIFSRLILISERECKTRT